MTKANEMAFPDPIRDIEPNEMMGNTKVYSPGLNKREYFAAIAMQGLLSTPDDSGAKFILRILGLPEDTPYEYPKHYMQYVALQAASAADALINELNKQP